MIHVFVKRDVNGFGDVAYEVSCAPTDKPLDPDAFVLATEFTGLHDNGRSEAIRFANDFLTTLAKAGVQYKYRYDD